MVGRPRGSGRGGYRGRGTRGGAGRGVPVAHSALVPTENGVNGRVSPSASPTSLPPPSQDTVAGINHNNVNNNEDTTPPNNETVAHTVNANSPTKTLAQRTLARRPTQPLQANLRNRKPSAAGVADQQAPEDAENAPDSPHVELAPEDAVTPSEGTPGDDSAATSDAASAAPVVRGKGRGGRPRGRGRGGRGRGRGRGATTATIGSRGVSPAVPVENTGRIGGPGSRGGKGAYTKAKKIVDPEEELENELLNGTATDISLMIPDYSIFAKPAAAKMTSRSRLKTIFRGEVSNYTLEQIRRRQAELAQFFKEGSKLMLDRNVERVKQAYGAVNKATPNALEEAIWHQKIRAELEIQECKQIAKLERAFALSTRSQDMAHAASVKKIETGHELKFVELADCAVRAFLREGGPMEELLGVADPFLFERVLQKTGLESMQEVTRADLIEAFESGSGRDRSGFDFPQVKTRSNEGLYDRKVLPTAGAILREKVSKHYYMESTIEGCGSGKASSSLQPVDMLCRLAMGEEGLPEEVQEALAPLKMPNTVGIGDQSYAPFKPNFPPHRNGNQPHLRADPIAYGNTLRGKMAEGRRHPEDHSEEEEVETATTGEKRKRSGKQSDRMPKKPKWGPPLAKNGRTYIAFEVPNGDGEVSDEEEDEDMRQSYIIGTQDGLFGPDKLVEDFGYNRDNPAQFWEHNNTRTTKEHYAIQSLMSLAGSQTEQHISPQTQIYQHPTTDDEDLDMTDIAESDATSSDEYSDEDEEEVNGMWETADGNAYSRVADNAAKGDVDKPIETDAMDFEVEQTPVPQVIPTENKISDKDIQTEKQQLQDHSYQDTNPQISIQDDDDFSQENVHDEEDQISEIDYQVPESEYGDDETFVRGVTEHSREEEYSSEPTIPNGDPAQELSIQGQRLTQDPKPGEEEQACQLNLHEMEENLESNEPNDIGRAQAIENPITLSPVAPIDAMTLDKATMPTQSSDHCMSSNPAPVAGQQPIIHPPPVAAQSVAPPSARRLAPAPQQNTAMSGTSFSGRHSFEGVPLQPTSANSTALLQDAPTNFETTLLPQNQLRPNGKPREPPRKKRGRPRDSKPAFTFRVDKQRVDTKAGKHQSTPKGKRGGSLTVLQSPPLLLPQPEVPNTQANGSGGALQPYPPPGLEAPTLMTIPPSQYNSHPHAPERMDDGSGWPRNFTSTSSSIALPAPPSQTLAYGVAPPPPPPFLAPRPATPSTTFSVTHQSPQSDSAPPAPSDSSSNGGNNLPRFYIGGGRWVAGPPPEVDSSVAPPARPAVIPTVPAATTAPVPIIPVVQAVQTVPVVSAIPTAPSNSMGASEVNEQLFEQMLYMDDPFV
ncbi:hypothetical protein K440DRAFT_646520 [Wilcoxina mikolae CBS 423.85]|nr:hypothetical protein K440DRAFT_646520 [Wilcoxina mikolae CBS 423.85]